MKEPVWWVKKPVSLSLFLAILGHSSQQGKPIIKHLDMNSPWYQDISSREMGMDNMALHLELCNENPDIMIWQRVETGSMSRVKLFNYIWQRVICDQLGISAPQLWDYTCKTLQYTGFLSSFPFLKSKVKIRFKGKIHTYLKGKLT